MNQIITPQSKQIEQKLFSCRQVTVATWFLGTLTGFALIAINYKRQGFEQKYYKSLMIGAISIVGLAVINIFLPAIPTTIYPFTWAILLRKWYKKEQHSLFKAHIRNGGEIEDNGLIFVIGLLAVFLSVAIWFVSAVVLYSLAGY